MLWSRNRILPSLCMSVVNDEALFLQGLHDFETLELFDTGFEYLGTKYFHTFRTDFVLSVQLAWFSCVNEWKKSNKKSLAQKRKYGNSIEKEPPSTALSWMHTKDSNEKLQEFDQIDNEA